MKLNNETNSILFCKRTFSYVLEGTVSKYFSGETRPSVLETMAIVLELWPFSSCGVNRKAGAMSNFVFTSLISKLSLVFPSCSRRRFVSVVCYIQNSF